MIKSTTWLTFVCFILLFSCEKEEPSSALKADFVLSENKGEVLVLNQGSVGLNYEIYIDGDVLKRGRLADTLAQFKFDRNGEHDFRICVYFNDGEQQARHCKEANFRIESLYPVIDWNFSYLGEGNVQVIDSSKYVNTIFRIDGLWGYWMELGESTIFQFDRNGTYGISINDGYDTETIEIKDLPEVEPLQTFTGNFFGEGNPPSKNGITQYYNSYGLLAISHSPVVTFENEEFGFLFRNNRSFYPEAFSTDRFRVNDKYDYFKELFKPGIINKKDWTPLAYSTDDFLGSLENILDVPGSSIEITEVKEVENIKITPYFSEKAFWVTFKIYADIPSKGLIDGYFKTKYVIY